MRRSRGNGGLHFLTILGISAIAIVCQAAPADVNLQIDHSDLRLRFSSSEASILLLPYLHDDTVWYKIQYLSFEEKKNMTESPRSVSKFGANFTYSSVTTLRNDSTNVVTGINLMANVREQLSGNDIPVTIRFMMFSKEATMQSGSEPVPVQKSSVKFTLDVSEWPFADESDYLYFHLLVSSSREENFSIVTTFRESGQIRMVKMKGSDEDGLFMQFPKTGIVDSQNQFVDVSVNSESQQAHAPSVDISFAFPFFRNLTYDPDMGIIFELPLGPIAPQTGNPSIAFVIVLIVIGALVVLFGIFLAVFSYQRAKARRKYAQII